MLVPRSVAPPHIKQIAIDTIYGQLVECGEDLPSDELSGQKIICVENSDDRSPRERESAINRIIKSRILFASNASLHVRGVSFSEPRRLVMLDPMKGRIGRGTVQYKVLDANPLGKPLPVYRTARPQNRFLAL